MLVAERVNKFITERAAPVCDRCIMDALKLSAHAHSAQITGALGTTSDFDRRMGTCSICKNERIVIRADRT